VLLRHATPRRNLASILARGLLTAESKGRMPVVWLHSPARSAWAICHTVLRHGGLIEDVVIIEVRVPRSWLRRARSGLWYSLCDVGPDRLRRMVGFHRVAASAVAA
jgi:hypothetical protein